MSHTSFTALKRSPIFPCISPAPISRVSICSDLSYVCILYPMLRSLGSSNLTIFRGGLLHIHLFPAEFSFVHPHPQTDLSFGRSAELQNCSRNNLGIITKPHTTPRPTRLHKSSPPPPSSHYPLSFTHTPALFGFSLFVKKVVLISISIQAHVRFSQHLALCDAIYCHFSSLQVRTCICC